MITPTLSYEEELVIVSRFLRAAKKRTQDKMSLGAHGTAFVEAARDINDAKNKGKDHD